MDPEVETTCITHRVALAVLPPGGGGGGEAVGAAQLRGDGDWGRLLLVMVLSHLSGCRSSQSLELLIFLTRKSLDLEESSGRNLIGLIPS